MRAPSFHVDFENAVEVTAKRHALRAWSEDVLRMILTRNRMEMMGDPDGDTVRRLLSGSILIRCELARRTADTALDGGVSPANGVRNSAA